MDFGKAIEALKAGERVARSGWNGKNMHIYLEDCMSLIFRRKKGNFPERNYEPCIIMFTAQGTHQPGWLANQADMLADDWEVVET
jgi:hypothetical protein